jgi:hypothetical protein
MGGRIMLQLSFDKYDAYCGPDLPGCGQRPEPFKAYWLRDAPAGLTLTNVRSAHNVFMCFVFI